MQNPLSWKILEFLAPTFCKAPSVPARNKAIFDQMDAAARQIR